MTDDLSPGINDRPDIATGYRGLLIAKITAVNTPGSGPLSGKKVYDWTEQAFDAATGASVNGYPPRFGKYTSTTEFHNVLLDANNATFAVGKMVWARMKGMVAGMTVYETVSAGDIPFFLLNNIGGTVTVPAGVGLNGVVAQSNLFSLDVGTWLVGLTMTVDPVSGNPVGFWVAGDWLHITATLFGQGSTLSAVLASGFARGQPQDSWYPHITSSGITTIAQGMNVDLQIGWHSNRSGFQMTLTKTWYAVVGGGPYGFFSSQAWAMKIG